MTREEAIAYGNRVIEIGLNDETQAFCEMAIKVLEQEPCGDCISREAVFDLMRSLTRWCVRSEDGKFNNVGLLYDDVMFGIDKLPSANPQEPKEGHWIICDVLQEVKCSECRVCFRHITNYCPNCGAKMEG